MINLHKHGLLQRCIILIIFKQLYNASNNELTFTTNPSSTYETTWRSNHVMSNVDGTHFSRSTELWTLNIHGDGLS
jgi:hypothetical protein